MSDSIKKSEYLKIFEEFRKKNDKEIIAIGKILGSGSFGEVRDIKFKNKIMAGKLIERKDGEKTEEEKLSLELRGQNIVRINKIFELDYKDKRDNKYKHYSLIIMDKAVLRDLGKLNEFYHRYNLLKLIYSEPFEETTGDYLLRFYTKQIIKGLDIFDRCNYGHFDIKPENLLISINLILKLSDFSLIRKLNNNIKIPGGTQGYLSPEYYLNRTVNIENAKKQDYFALGASLFKLKYGKSLLSYKKYEDKKINADRIIDLLIRDIAYIRAQKLTDNDFTDFLINLIQYKPEDRPSFENIIRNKWLNKNNEELEKIITTFETDEEKLIMELQKKDFLGPIEKKIENEEKDEKKKVKFRFKKRE